MTGFLLMTNSMYLGSFNRLSSAGGDSTTVSGPFTPLQHVEF